MRCNASNIHDGRSQRISHFYSRCMLYTHLHICPSHSLSVLLCCSPITITGIAADLVSTMDAERLLNLVVSRMGIKVKCCCGIATAARSMRTATARRKLVRQTAKRTSKGSLIGCTLAHIEACLALAQQAAKSLLHV